MKKYYFYDKKHKTYKEKLRLTSFYIDSLIIRVFNFLSKRIPYFYFLYFPDNLTRIWLKKYHLYVENLDYNKNNWIDAPDFKSCNSENEIEDIKVKNIYFYEILDIDELRRNKSKILKKYYKNADYFNSLEGFSILSKKIDDLLNNYSGNASGNFLYFDYSKKNNSKFDLIKHIFVNYNKIGESLLILSFEVQVSNYFEELQKKIFNSKSNILWEVTKFKFKFSKNGVSNSYGGNSLGNLSIFCFENLISDLTYQLSNSTKYINGHFLKKKNFPCLVRFENSGGEINHTDFFGTPNFVNMETKDKFILPNNYGSNFSNVCYYFEDLDYSINVKTSDQIKKYEKTDLIKSIGILYSINFYLDFNINKLIFKRGDLSKFIIKQDFLFYKIIPDYFYYVKLKTYSSRIKLFYERILIDIEFEKMFNFHFSESVKLFISDPNNFIKIEKNLEEYFQYRYKYKLKYFKKNLKLFNLVLTDFESLNTYKTNYFLQIVVILLTILTLYISIIGGKLTFDIV